MEVKNINDKSFVNKKHIFASFVEKAEQMQDNLLYENTWFDDIAEETVDPCLDYMLYK